MSSKYISITSNVTAGISGRGCGQFKDAAYINDTNGQGCWAVKGKIIPMGDLRVSTHEAHEYINAMFKVDSTRVPLPTQFYLNAG
jgi:hypothetical protein